MTKEYGIACLLDDESVKNLTDNIPFLEKENLPHISLFQFRCDDGNFLSLINEKIKNLSISKQFLTTNIAPAGNNIFLNIKDDLSLQTASDKITESYANYFTSKDHLSQINFLKLTSEQEDLVKKYGIYWVKQFYHPHVTLLYEQQLNSIPDLELPKVVTVLAPEIFKIDLIGRIKSKI